MKLYLAITVWVLMICAAVIIAGISAGYGSFHV